MLQRFVQVEKAWQAPARHAASCGTICNTIRVHLPLVVRTYVDFAKNVKISASAHKYMLQRFVQVTKGMASTS